MSPPQNSDNTSDNGDNPKYRFYGRRKGRTLTGDRSKALEQGLEKFEIKLENPHPSSLVAKKIFKKELNYKQFWLEIGFGNGEHLIAQAKKHTDIGFIGCEPFINGVSNLMLEANKQEISNIRVWPNDARLLMDTLCDQSLNRIFLLHPDPWHKTRHYKRRFIQKETLDTFSRLLKPGAELRIATDDQGLCEWMLEKCWNHPHFEWQAQTAEDWRHRPADWPETRYGQKQLAGIPVYLIFKKI